MIKYSKEHEWISVEGDIGTVGITDYAQKALGDVVFVELPEVGASFAANDECAVVESVKAASEIYAPVSGDITEVNSVLEDAPETVNTSPTNDGWFFKIKLSDPTELDGRLDKDAYEAFVKDLD